jgi:hypothetical protein
MGFGLSNEVPQKIKKTLISPHNPGVTAGE